MRDKTFKTNIGIVILHPTESLQRVAFLNEKDFAFYGCPAPNLLPGNIYRGTEKVLLLTIKIRGGKVCSFDSM